MSAIRLITVSRQFGAGGSDLARAVGRLLGWRVVDKEVVTRVAAQLRVPVREAEAHDEHVPSLAERVGKLLAGSLPEVLMPPVPPSGLDETEVADLADTILREAAASPPVILVGHGGMCLFQEREDALHVRVEAPREYRIREVARRMEMELDRAREEVVTRDADREHYIRRRFGRPAADSSLYSLVVNSARVPPARAARAVRALLERPAS